MQICSLHRLKKHTQVYAKIHFELEFRQYFWEKHVELVPLQVVEVIFQSKVSDFRVLKPWSFLELCSLLPTRDLPWTHKGASQHPPPSKSPAEIGLLKKSLDMSLIRELNEKHKTIKFFWEKLCFLTQCYANAKRATSKQLYIPNLQMNKHSYTPNLSAQDL